MKHRHTLAISIAIVAMMVLSPLIADAGFRKKPPGRKYQANGPVTQGIIREFDARDEVQIFIQGATGDFIEIQFSPGIICEGPDGRPVNHDRLEDAVDDGLLYMIEAQCRRGADGWVVWKAVVWPAQ